MPRFRITVAYDGTGLVGWQRQATGTSVQGLLEDAAGALDGQPVAMAGAGRTDAGVHAYGQVVSFPLQREIDPSTLVRALNAHLPEAVRVLDARTVHETFHARFDATGKTYRYRIWNADTLNPFERGYALHVSARLDVGSMDEAARRLEGRHDFAALQSLGSEPETTERVVFSSHVAAVEQDERSRLVLFEISGDGFLRHMVRAAAGTLLEIGRGRRPVEWITEVLESRDRSRAGQNAPADGLFLVGVHYEPRRA